MPQHPLHILAWVLTPIVESLSSSCLHAFSSLDECFLSVNTSAAMMFTFRDSDIAGSDLELRYPTSRPVLTCMHSSIQSAHGRGRGGRPAGRQAGRRRRIRMPPSIRGVTLSPKRRRFVLFPVPSPPSAFLPSHRGAAPHRRIKFALMSDRTG